jgi:hypothetical protein
MTCEPDCVCFNVFGKAGWLIDGYLGIYIYIKEDHFEVFHWVIGLLASLNNECSRQNVRNLNWLKAMASLVL